MKKMLAIVAVMICVGFVTGCGKEKKKEETKVVECTQNQSLSDYQISSNFKITATGEIVDKVEVSESYTSEKVDILDQLEETLNIQYDNLNGSYGGYDFTVNKTENSVTSTGTIDYSKFNSKAFAADKGLEDYLKDGRLTLEGVRKRYEMNGATCK